MPKIFVVGARGIPDVEGGAEKNAERLFPLVVARGWRVVLAGIETHIRASEYRGVELRSAPASRLFKTDKLAYYLRAVGIAREIRPDIVHFQGLGSAIMLWAYRLMGMKTVVRYGSVDYLSAKWGLLGRLGFRAGEYQLRFADAVIAVTPALAERLRARGLKTDIHVIANAADDTGSYKDDPELILPEKPYVLAVGRVTAAKNISKLIEGFNLFAAHRPEMGLVIAGGLDDETCVAGIKPLLTPQVKLLGRLPRSALGALYRNAHVYVNSSIQEGNSNAILEAISWQSPVLLSGITENRDFGLHEKHYFNQDDPRAIAEALDRADADRLSYVADSSSFMSWDDVADRTIAIYEKLLGSGSRPAPGTSDQA